MPVRVPHFQVVVHRNGKNIRLKTGEPFLFTSEEVAEITAMHPRALRRAVVERPTAMEVTSKVVEDEVDGDPDEMIDDDGDDTTPPVTRRAAAAKRKAPPKRPADATDEDEL